MTYNNQAKRTHGFIQRTGPHIIHHLLFKIGRVLVVGTFVYATIMRRFALPVVVVINTTLTLLGSTIQVSAWSPVGLIDQQRRCHHAGLHLRLKSAHHNSDFDFDGPPSFDPFKLSSSSSEELMTNPAAARVSPLVVGAAAALACPSIASAATAAPDAIPSALAAYGHYLSLLVITGAIMAERVLVKPAMSVDQEKALGYADITVGVAGVALLISGYYRATQYGKGWEFYSHEPLFWFKMACMGIFGGLSLFPTIMIIQRTVQIQTKGSIEPMSEKLASRLKTVLNAEISALAFIPLTATFMSRGIGYVDGFPTEYVGPAFFGVITAGAVYKYVKDALNWTE